MVGDNSKIYVLRGNLDEKKLNSLPDFEGCILVTGKVTFKSETTVPNGLIVMGNIEANKLTVEGSLICEGKCVVQELDVVGDLSVVQKGTEIQKLTLSGRLLSDKDSVSCNL